MTLKNMYAIHILTSLYASTSNTPHIGEQQMNHRIANHNQMPHSQITQPTHQVTAAEIEAMVVNKRIQHIIIISHIHNLQTNNKD